MPKSATPEPMKLLHSRADAAEMLSISTKSLDRMIRSGRLCARAAFSAEVLIHREEIERQGSLRGFEILRGGKRAAAETEKHDA